MSVVAYKDGILAADTRMTWGNNYQDGISKIFRSQEYLVGVCGKFDAALTYMEWIAEAEKKHTTPNLFHRAEPPEIENPDQTSVTLINKDGMIWTLVSNKVVGSGNTVEADGSGSGYAYGAMDRGATAIEAAQTAIKYDSGCGGEVIGVSFDKPVTDIEKGLTLRAPGVRDQYIVVG